MGDAGGAQHRGHAQCAQHHRGMAVGAAFLRRDAGQPGRIQQGGVGGPERFAQQDGAVGQPGKTLERRPCQVAHQAPGDLADFLGTSLQAGAVLRRDAGPRLGDDGLGDRIGLLDHGAFRRPQCHLDAPAHAADQPGRAEHADIRVDQRCDLGLALFRQDGEAGAQLSQLLARLRYRRFQPGALTGDVGGLDLMVGDLRHRLGSAKHRTDGDSRRDGDAREHPLRPCGARRGEMRQAFVLWYRRLTPTHRSPPQPVRRGRRAPPARPSPGRVARSWRPCRHRASSGP